MADETTDKSEADETTDDQVEATADETKTETAEGVSEGADEAADHKDAADDKSDESDKEDVDSSEESDKSDADKAEDDKSDKGDDEDDEAADKDDKSDEDDKSDKDDDEYGNVSMKQVEAILSHSADAAKDADLELTPQMKRMFDRELENTKRVEETIKGAKSNPAWFVPLFVALLIIGLIWVVAFYFTGKYPIPQIGQWNLLVGFGIMLVGFLMTMWWH